MSERARRRIPEATVARLPLYLRSLMELNGATPTVSSERLAELAGVNAAKVRKDLSYLGSYGTRGVGYDVAYLVFQMSRELGLTQDWPVVIVGVGNLGQALANYGGFTDRGFPVAALVDSDPAKVGKRLGGHVVRHIDDLPEVASELGVAIGIIATPASVAQEIADLLVAAGITSVLNFAPSVVNVPDGASLRKVDLASELQILSFYQQRRAASGNGPTAGHGVGGVNGAASEASRVGVAEDGFVIEAPLYPVNLRVDGQPCLVVGGGPVAARKASGLLDAGAQVTVVAPVIDVTIDELGARAGLAATAGLRIERRPYRPGEVAGYRLAITATGDPAVDGQVYADGEAQGVLVNSADDPDRCRFILPAVVRQGPLLATFSTSGASPALATWLRRRYADELGPEYLTLLDLLSEQRHRLQDQGLPTEGLDWQPALDSGMLELIREGHLAEAKERLEACLSSSSG